MKTADVFVEALRAEADRLELEVRTAGDRLTAVRLLLSSYEDETPRLPPNARSAEGAGSPSQQASIAQQAPSRRPAAADPARPGPGKAHRGPSWDVERGRKLWDAGKTAEQIAAECGAPSVAAVQYIRRSRKWPARRRSTIQATDCPHCAKTTKRNPCEGCGMQLAPGELGKRRGGRRAA